MCAGGGHAPGRVFGSGRRLPRGRALSARIVVAAFFCNALPFTMFSIGQQTIDSGVAGVLNATTPLWSLLLGLLIGTERGIRPIRLTGLVLGFGGTVLIFAPWQQAGSIGWGALAIVVAAASYAVASRSWAVSWPAGRAHDLAVGGTAPRRDGTGRAVPARAASHR